jgi:ABC-type nitrate/sulfonate/bicarbonate transport system substrate-binding protein
LAGTLLCNDLAFAQPSASTVDYVIGASSPSLTTESSYYAERLGFFKSENLNVKVQHVSSDSLALRALLGGEGDLAWVGTTAAIRAIAQGAKLKLISAPIVKSTNVIAAQKKFKTLADLKGANIAVSSIGAVSYHIPRIILQRNNVDPDSVNYVAVGGLSARFQALAAKKLDAAMLDILGAYEGLDRYDFLHVLASVAKEVPDLHFISVVASERAIKEKREALVRFVRSDVRALRFAAENPKKAAQLSASRIPVKNPENLVRGFQALAEQGAYGLDGGLDGAVLQKTVDIMMAIGELKEPVSVQVLVAPDIVKQALK